MEWTNREMLKRIVALLFALADLADRASLSSRPIRGQVLDILRPAEAVARALVLGAACDPGVMMPPHAGLDGDAPDDATRLALSLRILALALANLAAQAERGPSRGSCRIATKPKALRKPGRSAWRQSQGAPAFDTS